MSSPTNQTAIWNYNGDGITQTFAVGQPIQSVNDVKVTTTTAGVVSAPYTVGVDYNVTGVGTSSINVVFLALVPAVGTTVTITLNMVLIPNTSISTLTTNTGTVIQGAIDKLSLQDISQAQQINSLATAIAGGGVLSVNGNTGAVTITPANINAAPINSPALTGTPTAPTASAGTNTTQIATTAFVQATITSGTWTPTLASDGTDSGQAFNSQVGYYTKVNCGTYSVVTLFGSVGLTTVGTFGGSTNARIKGLPFTANSNISGTMTVGYQVGTSASLVSIGGIVVDNTNYINLIGRTAAATANSSLTPSQAFTNTVVINFTATYIV